MSDPIKEEKKPCGNYHPLPCGLDVWCEVPEEYHRPRLTNKEIYQNYKNQEENYKMKDLNEYQEQAEKTAIFPNELPEFLDIGQIYTVLGQGGESGEIEEKLKKAIREDDEEYIEDMRDEIGDVLWYLSQVCEEFGWELGSIAEDNLDKLQDRQERGKLTGEGDER